MSDPQLPDDLRDLDSQLAERSRHEPGVGLRDRVLTAVRRERRSQPALAAWRGTGRFAAALAAAVLLWANLSMSAALDTSWHFMGNLDSGRLDATAGDVRRLLPEYSEREAYRHALLAQTAARLTPMPNPRSMSPGLLSAGGRN